MTYSVNRVRYLIVLVTSVMDCGSMATLLVRTFIVLSSY